MENPTKTFGLSTSMEVFMKLEFDLKRLKEAQYTKDVQFAALDLAVWGFHMIDWVLNEVTDTRHIEITGHNRGARQAIAGFVEKQSDRLRVLGFCGQIANTGKHRVLTRQIDDATFLTSHTIHFEPPLIAGQSYGGKIYAAAFLKNTASGQKIGAGEFFTSMVEQWRGFLKAESLYDWEYNIEPAFDPTMGT